MIWLPPADWPIPLFFCLFRWPAPCLWLYSACPLNRFDAFGQGAAEKSSAESEQILQNTLLDKKRKAKRKGYLSPSLTSMEPTISPSGEIPFSTSQFGKNTEALSKVRIITKTGRLKYAREMIRVSGASFIAAQGLKPVSSALNSRTETLTTNLLTQAGWLTR